MFNALVLSLPTRNSTLRMRVWRALKDCGAAVLRDGVYLLPQAQAFDRLEKEIRAHGGFAMTFDATPHAENDHAALRASGSLRSTSSRLAPPSMRSARRSGGGR